MSRPSFVWIAAFGLVAGCTGKPPDPRSEDTPTFGDVSILADQDFRRLLENESSIFEHYYVNAHPRISYLTGDEVLKGMGNDTVRAVFTTALPGADQQAHFRLRSLYPQVVPILTDGIAVIVGSSSGRDRMTLDELRAVLTGTSKGLRAVFDASGSGAGRTVADSLFGGDVSALKNATAARDAEEVCRSVSGDTTLIGLIAFAHLSDLDDARCRSLRKGLRILPLALNDTGRAVEPNQATLADGSYPLRRRLYAIVTEGRSGLGTGFVSFVAGHKGQRIILKQGLAPQQVPEREVQIVNE